MQFQFDLISDLHVQTWAQGFDWTGQATSPHCLVVGDIDTDLDITARTLEHLGAVYKGGVFYIDGNDEHRPNLHNLKQSYRELDAVIGDIDNVVYLQDNVVVINGVAILATNGWWSFDMDQTIDYEQTMTWFENRYQLSTFEAEVVANTACQDAAYMLSSVKRLQRLPEVKAIVMATHTVPAPWIIEHDIELVDSQRFNCMGNRHMQLALDEDTESKIKAWCFGHYHNSVDMMHNGVRYVNNCRGRGDTQYRQHAYYPKRIVIDY